MGATHMVLAKSSLSEKDSMNMIDEIKKVDGVKLAVSMDSLTGHDGSAGCHSGRCEGDLQEWRLPDDGHCFGICICNG